jgi:hypothetical protein
MPVTRSVSPEQRGTTPVRVAETAAAGLEIPGPEAATTNPRGSTYQLLTRT